MSTCHSALEIDSMSVDEAVNTLNVRLHDATSLVDELAASGKINASAQFVRQEICCHARRLIEQRWIG